MLNVTAYDGPDTRPLLIAHGLFGSARNWGSIAKRLAENRPVLAVDMRNHGDSHHTETHGYEDMADDLAQVIDDPMDVLGHSMGGKAAMTLALTQPRKVARLIVADIAPVAYDHSQLELVEAMKSLPLDRLSSRADADAALSESVPERAIRSFLLQSLDVRQGKWSLNLDTLGREMSKILAFPDIDTQFEGPALFLAGGNSDYVTDAHRDRISALFPEAQVVRIKGAGHWLHAEAADEVVGAVQAFLNG